MNSQITRKPGSRLTKLERDELIVQLVDLINSGYKTQSELADKLHIDRSTLTKLQPLADQILAVTTENRNIIRNVMINRAFRNIELLSKKLENKKLSLKQQLSIHDRILKYDQHISLVSGLNTEVKVNIDHNQLVITRAHPDAVRKAIDATVTNKDS